VKIPVTVAPRLYIFWLCKDLVNARRAQDRAQDKPWGSLSRQGAQQKADARFEEALSKLREALSVPEDQLNVVAGEMECLGEATPS